MITGELAALVADPPPSLVARDRRAAS